LPEIWRSFDQTPLQHELHDRAEVLSGLFGTKWAMIVWVIETMKHYFNARNSISQTSTGIALPFDMTTIATVYPDEFKNAGRA
jgi:hypothetical protein